MKDELENLAARTAAALDKHETAEIMDGLFVENQEGFREKLREYSTGSIKARAVVCAIENPALLKPAARAVVLELIEPPDLANQMFAIQSAGSVTAQDALDVVSKAFHGELSPQELVARQTAKIVFSGHVQQYRKIKEQLAEQVATEGAEDRAEAESDFASSMFLAQGGTRAAYEAGKLIGPNLEAQIAADRDRAREALEDQDKRVRESAEMKELADDVFEAQVAGLSPEKQEALRESVTKAGKVAS